MIKEQLQYLWYVLRHKRFTFQACARLGVPLLGIVHDMSKFGPAEWMPYVRKFNPPECGWWSERDFMVRLGTICGPTKDSVDREFDVAWNHHQKSNKHHWQYWLLVNDDDGQAVPLPMPDRYRREMLADWRGTGRALGKPDTAAWYEENKDNMILHSDTRQWVENELRSNSMRKKALFWNGR